MEMDGTEAQPEDGMEGLAGPSATTVAGTVYGDDAKSEMFLDPSPDQEFAQIAAFRNREAELAEDREFPDEIELQPNVLARERLARYRGLKSLRSSKWETSEDRPWQPEDWDRLAQIQDYRGMKNRVINEALVGGVQAGTRVLVYLRNGSPEVVQAFKPERPMILWGLLRHEHKQAVVNVSITASTDYQGEAVKSKDELIIQIGPRRLHVNPLYSTAGGTGPNNVAKFERFLIPGRTSVATFVGPLTWGNVPVVAWKRGDGETDWELVGQGSFLGVDRDRVVAKRIVLTGHPYKIHKRIVTVRYMFFNRGKFLSRFCGGNSADSREQKTWSGSRLCRCTRAAAGVGSLRNAWEHTDTSRRRLTGESIPRMLWRLVFTRECFPGVRLSLQSRQGSLDTALIDWLVR
jgi:pre-rRNA-processing protein TSR1